MLFQLRKDHLKSRENLLKIKSRRLKNFIKYLKNSPFYSAYISQNSLESFPVINKEVFMRNFDEINTLGIKKTDAFNVALKAEKSRDFSSTIRGVTVGLSTGTSGNKGIFLASKKERAKWAAAVIHRILGMSLQTRKIAFFLRANSKLYESANSRLLRFNFFDLMSDHDANFKRLAAIKADILVAQPSALLNIASSFTKSGIKPTFSKVISVAEVLNQSDRVILERVFGLKLDEVYQCTEGFLACTCSYGKLHFNEDYLIIEKEYIDVESKRYYPIITDLYRKTQPIVRYKLDDILISGVCKCGNQYEVVDKIEGRADDIIRLKDRIGNLVDIYPDYFSRAITVSSDDINDYVLSQTEENKLEIYINSKTEQTRQLLRVSINELLSRFNIGEVEIQFTSHKASDDHSKLRRIRNEYNKRMQDYRNR